MSELRREAEIFFSKHACGYDDSGIDALCELITQKREAGRLQGLREAEQYLYASIGCYDQNEGVQRAALEIARKAIEAKRQSWVSGEMEMGNDADERRYRESIDNKAQGQ